MPVGFGLVAPYGRRGVRAAAGPRRRLAATVGAVLGTGAGRGIGFMYVLFGLGMVLSAVAMRIRALARFDPEVPDALPTTWSAYRRWPRSGRCRRDRDAAAAVDGGAGAGTGSLELPVPAAAGDRLLLAAYLRVVALLTGEPTVTVGYGAAVVEAEITGSWRDLAGTPLKEVPGTDPDTAFAGPAGTLSVLPADGVLVLRYARERVDEPYARRIGGYLVRALAAAVADPAVAVDAADLLGPAERARQLSGLDGPARPLPDRRAHELIAAQARRTPAAVAVVHGDRSWTYAELDAAADRVARALLGAGLEPEEVVAVVTGRTAEWLAAILGTFRAGGVYLPVEPEFRPGGSARWWSGPAAGWHWSRTRCPVWNRCAAWTYETCPRVVPNRGRCRPRPSRTCTSPPARPGCPRAALCEHAGMLNHLLAKVEDLGLGPADAVVQNAGQTFDISLWQLVAPLLAGGRTVLVDRETILDPGRFVDRIVAAGASVLQVVPSYLDVLLRHLEERPRPLGRLRAVSVTGEAISKALVTRWFAAQPEIALVNAYGATEASDDTTHEIMTRVPDEDLVPVGRPVRNVTVTVLGPDDELLPLGAVGEITFSGVCVGRGYVNDPERTAEAFGPDPLRPGVRLYRTGDYGRWLPSGSLEFRGRRDEQVKVHGIRIELGEVERPGCWTTRR